MDRALHILTPYHVQAESSPFRQLIRRARQEPDESISRPNLLAGVSEQQKGSQTYRKVSLVSAKFRADLANIFENALSLRYDWEKIRDAQYTFDFPCFKTPFNEQEHYSQDEKGRAIQSRPECENRIFLTLMFGIKARIRKSYDEDYGEEVTITKSGIYPLD